MRALLSHRCIVVTDSLTIREAGGTACGSFAEVMVNDRKNSGSEQPFRRVALSELRQGRRGKHHVLVMKVIQELKESQPDEALEIPLSTLGGVSIGDFRSATNRAAASQGFGIATYSDNENVYVWKRSARTKQYERRRAKAKR